MKDTNTQPNDNFTANIATSCQSLKNEIGKVLIGQDAVIEQVLIALLAGGHVLIEGVPGLGKTLLIRALAKTFSGKFVRIQFTPDLMPSDVTGHVIYDTHTGKFHIRKGPVFTNLLLADEINRAPAKAQASLLEVMQEHQVTIEGQSMSVPSPFMVLATQNPIEQEGTYPLPEAQLDRFLMKIKINYPNANDEYRLVHHVTQQRNNSDTLDVSSIKTFLQPDDIKTAQATTHRVVVDQRVNNYAVEIVRHSRDWPGIAMGAGPRGGIALVKCAQAAALITQRDFVIPDDIKKVALPVLRHRIIMTPEMQLEGTTTDNIILDLLEKIDAPRL